MVNIRARCTQMILALMHMMVASAHSAQQAAGLAMAKSIICVTRECVLSRGKGSPNTRSSRCSIKCSNSAIVAYFGAIQSNQSY